MQIYLARNNEQAGPYSLQELNQMLADDQVALSDLAWHEGMKDWQKLGDLTQGQRVYQPTTTVTLSPPSAHASTSTASNTTSTASSKSAAQKTQTSTKTNTQALSSINKRVIAKIIDILLLWIPSSIIFGQFVTPDFVEKYQMIAGKSVFPSAEQQEQLLSLISTLPQNAYYAVAGFALAYFVLQAFLLHKFGQSIGKKAVGIMIVDDQTMLKTNITRSFLIRSVVFIILNYFVFLIAIIDFGFIFTKRNRTLHDRLAKTVVVDRPTKQ